MWISDHGLNFEVFTNHVTCTFLSYFTNHVNVGKSDSRLSMFKPFSLPRLYYGENKKVICPKVTKMGSITSCEID